MSSCYVFDSYALLALLEDEPGADLVAGVINKQGADIYISSINLGEIYYLLLRRSGLEQAESVLESIVLEEKLTVAEASWVRVKAAASVKATGGLSYADAFAVSLAKEFEAPLLTGDPEIIAKAEEIGIQVLAV
jgi:PIN domain nuclease of toxin-antitoxin system